MRNIEVAERIVGIQETLNTGSLLIRDRELLTEEQRRLWDEEFLGETYENIARDVWMFRY